MRSTIAKRILDVVGSVAALLLALPALFVTALAVRIRLGTPILFRQRRPGLRGVPFTIYKFRTMTNVATTDADGPADADRLTGLGRFLRSTSLDELPELYNVLRGDMSLVGPRPLLMEYMGRYSAEQRRRHDVKPGLTGWAQVQGRNAVGWTKRFELDTWYVDHWSLWIDLKIVLRTVTTVLSRRGVSQPGRATVDYFQGNGHNKETA